LKLEFFIKPDYVVDNDGLNICASRCFTKYECSLRRTDTSSSEKSPEKLFNERVKSMSEKHMQTYLKYKTVYHIPQYQIDDIFNDIYNIIQDEHETCKQTIPGTLKTYNIDTENSKAILNQIQISNTFNMVHEESKYDSKKQAYFVNSAFYVAPQQLVLGTDKNGEQDICHYIPLHDMLKAVVSRDDIRDLVCKSIESSSNSIKSFVEGSSFKKHGLFNKSKYSLYI
jgi:hypothetical protein